MAEVHNALSEDLSFRRVIRLAENVPGIALYFMHVSAATGVEAIGEARARGLADLRRDAAPVPDVHHRGLQAPERPDLPHLSVAQVAARTRTSCGRARWTARFTRVGHRRSVLHPCASRSSGKRIDDTTGGNVGVEPRVSRHVHRDGRAARLFAREVRRSRLAQRREDHGPVSAQGRASPPAATPTSRCSIPASAARSREEMLHEADYSPWEGHEVARLAVRSPCCAARWWSRTASSTAT